MMVVIPTSTHVTMTFERSATDYIAYLLSLIGIALIFVFRKYVPITFPSPHPFEPRPVTMSSDSSAMPDTPAPPVGAWDQDEWNQDEWNQDEWNQADLLLDPTPEAGIAAEPTEQPSTEQPSGEPDVADDDEAPR